MKIWANEEILLLKTQEKVNKSLNENQLIFIISWFPKYSNMVGEYLLNHGIACRVIDNENALNPHDRQKVFLIAPEFFDNPETFKQFFAKSIVKRVNFIFWGIHPLFSENIKRKKQALDLVSSAKVYNYISSQNFILKNFLCNDVETLLSRIERNEDGGLSSRKLNKSFQDLLKKIESTSKSNKSTDDYLSWFQQNNPNFK